MSTTFRILSTVFLLTSLQISAFSQSDSLQVRYDELMQKSETYEQFKVIRTNRLTSLWSEVQDTISTYQRQQSSAESEIKNLKSNQGKLSAEIEQLKEQLVATESQLGKLTFLGADINATAYHSIVWGIILVLAILIIISYGMFLRSNALTRTTSNDLNTLKEEFEQLKERARERETKIKRELQTAVNTLEEYKRGIKK